MYADRVQGVEVSPHRDAAVAEHLATLRELAADRPAHARYLEALLAAEVDAMDDVPVPSGVSVRVAEAILMDVEWLRDPSEPAWRYPGDYRLRRSADAWAAHKKKSRGMAWGLP